MSGVKKYCWGQRFLIWVKVLGHIFIAYDIHIVSMPWPL
mgnify:CR=1 FL=1